MPEETKHLGPHCLIPWVRKQEIFWARLNKDAIKKLLCTNVRNVLRPHETASWKNCWPGRGIIQVRHRSNMFHRRCGTFRRSPKDKAHRSMQTTNGFETRSWVTKTIDRHAWSSGLCLGRFRPRNPCNIICSKSVVGFFLVAFFAAACKPGS